MATVVAVLVATWNVNSLRARMPRVQEWLAATGPDVVCLQETKLSQDAFPAAEIASLGYESAHFGQGQWNGVAILSRVGLTDVVRNFAPGVEPDGEARIITATCAGLRISSVYVPNGREVDHDHYRYKLSWLARLGEHLARDTDPAADVIVTGDFNVAPTDADVWDPASFVGATHVSEPERGALAEVCSRGLVDVWRRLHGDERAYSWWDYRGGAFHKGQGMRIDLVLASESVLARTTSARIDRDARKGEKPSDHAPVLVEVNQP